MKEKIMKPNPKNFRIVLDKDTFIIEYIGYHICDLYRCQSALEACGKLEEAKQAGSRLIYEWIEEWPNTYFYPKINEIHQEFIYKASTKQKKLVVFEYFH